MIIIVKPIDLSKPGSMLARDRYFEVTERLDALVSLPTDQRNWREIAKTYSAMKALIIPCLETDDGTSIEEALKDISAEEFDGFFSKIAFGAESIPPQNASSSS